MANPSASEVPRPPAVTAGPDPAVAETLLHLLARAVRQVNTYPPASPLRAEALEACLAACRSWPAGDPLEASVIPTALRVGESLLGAGGLIEQELARRLYRARVAGLTITSDLSLRELTRFCELLLAAGDDRAAGPRRETLEEDLVEAGVSNLAVRTATQPAMWRVETPEPAQAALLERERERQAAATESAGGTLYPPDKGWIRVDPAMPVERLSLTELAILVEDPAQLAVMLMRLTDDLGGAEAGDPSTALDRKYGEVVTLFSGLEPRLATVMFSRLARAVLNLPTERRTELLRRSVLPGLLDGGREGEILKEFPDVELSESLCLLLDVETAAPELLVSALDRLGLSEERRRGIAPMLDAEIARRQGQAGTEATDEIDGRARRLIRVRDMSAESLAEFTAFDLALDATAQAGLDRIARHVLTCDAVLDRLGCLLHMLRLEPNPVLTAVYTDTALAILADRLAAREWPVVRNGLLAIRAIKAAVAPDRPDVAAALQDRLAAWTTAARLDGLLGAVGDPEHRPGVEGVVGALAPNLGAAALDWLSVPRSAEEREALLGLVAPHAASIANELAVGLEGMDASGRRAALRLLGGAAEGHEPEIAAMLTGGDAGTAGEALRALRQAGTPAAADAIAGFLLVPRTGELIGGALEALLHCRPEAVRGALRRLLAPAALPARNPALVERILDRLHLHPVGGLDGELARLARWPARFWSPQAHRIRRKAAGLLRS